MTASRRSKVNSSLCLLFAIFSSMAMGCGVLLATSGLSAVLYAFLSVCCGFVVLVLVDSVASATSSIIVSNDCASSVKVYSTLCGCIIVGCGIVLGVGLLSTRSCAVCCRSLIALSNASDGGVGLVLGCSSPILRAFLRVLPTSEMVIITPNTI